jgi:hypothetical protein
METTVTVLPPMPAWDTLKNLRAHERGPAYRGIIVAPPVQQWWERGNCYDEDPSLFEIDENSHPHSQHEKIAEGLRKCAGCPVMSVCLNESTEEDRRWTTRGGRPPLALWTSAREKREEEEGLDKRAALGETCGVCGSTEIRRYKRGKTSGGTSNGQTKKVCLACQRVRSKKHRKERAAAKLDS